MICSIVHCRICALDELNSGNVAKLTEEEDLDTGFFNHIYKIYKRLGN